MPHRGNSGACNGGAGASACQRPLAGAFFLSSLRPDHRQHDLRSPAATIVDGVFGHPPAAVVVKRFARVRVHIEAREVTARNIDADAVAALKYQRGRIHFDGELLGLPRLQKLRLPRALAVARSHDAVGDVEIHAARVILVGRASYTVQALPSRKTQPASLVWRRIRPSPFSSPSMVYSDTKRAAETRR